MELIRYACRLLTTYTLINCLCSVLKDIEKQSQALREKGGAARLLDEAEDSKEVVKLIEQLQEAIIHYQVSEDWIVVLNTAEVGEKTS